MGEIVRVPFHGDDILAVEVDGKPHVVLKPALDLLGLDYWPQIEKLKRRSWAALASRQVQVSDQAQRREMLTCDVRTFRMLLATIDENRVSEDVRPRLVTYQCEVADAIEDYFFHGVAINPRIDVEQAARVIAIFRGANVGDPGYWDTKARQLTGRVLGETPEYDPATRPLTVSVFFEQQGMTGKLARKHLGTFGKALKAVYRVKHHEDPPTIDDLVGRHMVPVAQYQEQHRPLFVEVWNSLGLAAELGDAPNVSRMNPRGGAA